MLLRLFNTLRGWVVAETRGVSPERLINIAANRGVYIWDVHQAGLSVRLSVTAKGFKALKPCIRLTRCKLRIIERHGLPFLIFKYRKRGGLAAGLLLFLLGLLFLSSFIWRIEISGTVRLEAAEIRRYLGEIGVKEGVFNRTVSDKECEQKLMLRFPEISWADVEIRGTLLSLRLVENVPETPPVDRSQPCNVSAAKRGVIVSAATSTGRPLVKAGDVVEQGDVLVTSELQVGTAEEGYRSEYVHAEASVLAKVYYKLETFVPFDYDFKNYTGKTSYDYSIMIAGEEFRYYKADKGFAHSDVLRDENTISVGDWQLPLAFASYEAREYILERRTRTSAQAEEYARVLSGRRLMTELNPPGDIIDIAYSTDEQADGLTLTAIITVVEDIAEKTPLDVPSEPEEPEETAGDIQR